MIEAGVGASGGRSRTAFLARKIVVPYPLALGSILALMAIAFGRSYWSLVSFAGSEEPESLVLVLPLIGLVLLAAELARLGRHGNEVGLNLVFAAPLLAATILLLIWVPPRLSYFYWVYRLDLLAAVVFLAALVVLFFGVPELLSTRLVFPLLLLGWPPLLDALGRYLAGPLATVSAFGGWLLAAPFAELERHGTRFTFPRRGGLMLEVSSACSGLIGILTMAALAGLVAYLARGSRWRRLIWVAVGLALALALNAVRIAIILVVADRAGPDRAYDLLHALAGILLFALALAVMLLVIRRFKIEPALPAIRRSRPLEFKLRGLIGGGLVLLAVTSAAAWATTGFQYREAGLYEGAPAIRSGRLLAPAEGYFVRWSYRIPLVAALFGKGSKASVTHFFSPRGTDISAQVVVTSSYRKASRYSALDCFVFHRFRVYSVHRAALPGGGSVALIAIRADKTDLATASWLQPVLVDGRRAWRRVVLFAYLKGKPVESSYHPSWSRRLGLWLLNTFSPYGGTRPPERFRVTERELTAAARALALGERR
jgi:exosortase